jgi:hydrogenase maturation protein HypF
MQAWGKPLLATSGNVSGSPIVYEDDKAIESLSEVADIFLVHNREIQISEDDSVIRFSKHQQPVFLRRSRGFAPTLIHSGIKPTPYCILAMGADMKSAFTVQANGQVYVSQYLGDLESYESQECYRHALDHLLALLRVRPQQIVIDAHPNYFSSQLGRQLATVWGVPVEEVFHHEAHAWASLAESDLLACAEPALCVVWDGTGYGSDGQSWGGEFFVYNTAHQLTREIHFGNVPMWNGDAMAQEPRLAALFLCRDFIEETALSKKFNETEWKYYVKLIQTKPPVHTSSVGRLFDAVASLLNICDHNSFEGEAALLLETCASKGKCLSHYTIDWQDNTIDTGKLIKQILVDIDEHVPVEKIAYKFHVYLAEVISAVIDKTQIKTVTFSGGVFQNTLLIDLIEKKIGSSVQVHWHHGLSPNDENISFGQLVSVVQSFEQARKEIKVETV